MTQNARRERIATPGSQGSAVSPGAPRDHPEQRPPGRALDVEGASPGQLLQGLHRDLEASVHVGQHLQREPTGGGREGSGRQSADQGQERGGTGRSSVTKYPAAD
ncbi:unnamed protein product [Prorocentrum cordatum]|uniref:Uncharacterized protein n=1 Tax=Prorocentrum cordatum TaxID=2364126 RepID=A0ABN9RI25_9DINO|nr:unnamed protein product [Polarella glacialis]